MNSLTNVAIRFSEMAERLQNAGDFDEVDLREGHEITVTPRYLPRSLSALLHPVQNYYEAYLPTFATGLPKEPSSLPNDNTSINYLARVFGRIRLQRICQRCGLDLSTKGPQPLTKAELEWLIIKAAEVLEEDLQELLQEIQASGHSVRFLDEKESDELRKHFVGAHSLELCTNHQLESLFELLIPFHSIAHIFFNNVPKPEALASDSGKLLVGMKERVYLCEKLRRKNHTELEWVMQVIKRLVDREMPRGVVFRNAHGGFCKVHDVVFAKGAYKCFLKHIGVDSQGQEPIILYRGTRLPILSTDSLSTLIEDVRYQLGSKGPQATFEKTKALLSDPRMGFVTRPDEMVRGIGMSLGATHLKRDAVLFAGRFKTLFSVAGPAPDALCAKQYADYINMKGESAPKESIHYIWEADDVTHHLGEIDLGAGCHPNKIDINIIILDPKSRRLPLQLHLSQITEESRFPKATVSAHAWLMGALELQKRLGSAHTRITFELPHTVVHLTNQTLPDLVNKILLHQELCDPAWEEMRKLIAYA